MTASHTQGNTDMLERAVIGQIINDPDQMENIELSDSLFNNRRHQILAQVIRELHARNISPDLVNVVTALNQRNQMEMVGGSDYVIAIPGETHGGYLEHYLRMLTEHQQIRAAKQYADEIIKAVHSGDLNQIQDAMSLSPMETAPQDDRLISASEANRKVIERCERILAGEKPEIYETGIKPLDGKLANGGLEKQQLIVIGARPSIGKSVMGRNIAESICAPDAPSLMCIMEMSSEDMQMRAISGELGTHVREHLKSGDINRIREAARMTESNVYYDDTPEQSVEHIQRQARRLIRQHGKISGIVIDYLQLMKRPAGANPNDQINQITRKLKQMARQLNCPIILLSQLSRDVEKRPDKRPVMSDLRESGGIEQDADIILLLYRDHYYNKRADPHEAECNVAKQRNGETGTINLRFHGPGFRFS